MPSVLKLLLALAVATPAHAAVLFTDGFEAPNLGPGGATLTCCGIQGAPPGWDTVGTAGREGVFNQQGTGRFTSMVDGQQLAFIQPFVSSGVGRLIRDAGVAVQAGDTYTLTVAIGSDLADPVGDNWQMELWSGRPLDSGGVPIATVNAASAGAVLPQAGGWAFNTLQMTAAASAGELWVALVQIEMASGAHTANFDAVTLSDTGVAVPEPATVGLLAALLAGAAFGRRGYRKTTTPAA